jgi:hypothetical protein
LFFIAVVIYQHHIKLPLYAIRPPFPLTSAYLWTVNVLRFCLLLTRDIGRFQCYLVVTYECMQQLAILHIPYLCRPICRWARKRQPLVAELQACHATFVPCPIGKPDSELPGVISHIWLQDIMCWLITSAQIVGRKWHVTSQSLLQLVVSLQFGPVIARHLL